MYYVVLKKKDSSMEKKVNKIVVDLTLECILYHHEKQKTHFPAPVGFLHHHICLVLS